MGALLLLLPATGANSDGRSKLQAVLSSAGDRIAYYEQCIEGEGCTPSVVIVDLKGKAFSGFGRSAGVKLDRREAATSIKDLSALPGNFFEALKGDRRGQYSIRINDQWRICFEGRTVP